MKALLRQLLDVLGYVHDNKYVHRDIKCSNLLIDNHLRLKVRGVEALAAMLWSCFGTKRKCTSTVATNREPSPGSITFDYPTIAWNQLCACCNMHLHGREPYVSTTASPHLHIASVFRPLWFYNAQLADFGLARRLSDAPAELTNRVITLWYRPPELLLGATRYGPSVDCWGVGCIFAELIIGKPLFPAKVELEQLEAIFKVSFCWNSAILQEYVYTQSPPLMLTSQAGLAEFAVNCGCGLQKRTSCWGDDCGAFIFFKYPYVF